MWTECVLPISPYSETIRAMQLFRYLINYPVINFWNVCALFSFVQLMSSMFYNLINSLSLQKSGLAKWFVVFQCQGTLILCAKPVGRITTHVMQTCSKRCMFRVCCIRLKFNVFTLANVSGASCFSASAQ